jgi:hypothetical protein
MQLGLAVPPQLASTAGFAAPNPAPPAPAPQQLNVGGIMSVKSLASTLAVDQAAAAAADQANKAQNEQVVAGLAAHIQKHWTLAKEAKQDVEKKMLNAVRSRRGEYPPDKLAKIKAQGGSEIYMLLFATKARQAKALLGDVLIGAGTEKPWTFSPTPRPDLPPEQVTEIMQGVYQMVQQAEMAGAGMAVAEIREIMQEAKDRAESQLQSLARMDAARAELEVEDVLVEGGWLQALDEFLDDLTTFKTAFLKGPVIRNVPVLTWQQQSDGTSRPVVDMSMKKHWERCDPLMMYPAPWARNTNDAELIERHKLSPEVLSAMIGVEGYNDEAIRAVLAAHGANGLHEWLQIDAERPQAEGRDLSVLTNRSNLIDALQFWGSVSGKMLREWGMKPAQVPDEAKYYQVECWLIGSWVIKAVINQDPMGRRPYYSDGYSRIPGAFWHNSLFDIVEDCQDMCNAAARAVANNLGISSGPQVDVNTERLAAGETITEMYPWKVWQTISDPMGSTAKAINFFQPDSHASELMGVYEKFSALADEISGIPRYMAGVDGIGGGAGRTASGMSMMIGNASKTTKQLVGSLDMRVISPSVGREYEAQIQTNPRISGDLRIIARGALSLATREAAQVRRNEFLLATANPFDMQIMGVEGRAAVLRETAKTLSMDVDRVVPSAGMLRQRQIQMAMAAQQQPQPGGEQLQDGAPTTDHFSPAAA